MREESVLAWVQQAKRRQHIISALGQPMTANQLSWKTDISLDCCSYVLKELETRDLVQCLNPSARRSRLYWITPQGLEIKKLLCAEEGKSIDERELISIDWDVYGWLCFAHRAAVTIAITEPLQPSAIKKKLRQDSTHLNISANNIRDIIKLLLQRGVVRPVSIKKKAHLRYELTDTGRIFRRLLLSAGMSHKH